MTDTRFAEFKRQIAELRALLADKRAEEVLSYVAHEFRKINNLPKPDELTENLPSPFRQLYYIVGMLMSTPEPAPASALPYTDTVHKRCIKLSREIFDYNVDTYFVLGAPAASPSQDQIDNIGAVMPAFIQYFYTGPLGTSDQIRARLERTCAPYSDLIQGAFGLSLSQMLACIDWIERTGQAKADALHERIQEERGRREALLDEGMREAWKLPRLRKEALGRGHRELFETMLSEIDTLFQIDVAAFRDGVGAGVADRFFELFALERKEREFFFPTEDSPAFDRPLVMVTPTAFVIPCASTVPHYMLRQIERALAKLPSGPKFLAHRDLMLEREVEASLRRMIPGGEFFPQAFETPKTGFEHDLIVIDGETMLVVESKASPPREPLRDPEKAAVRLRDDVKSDRGIQKGFDQADRAISLLRSTGKLDLFDKKGKLLRTVRSEEITRAHSIVVTRDSWGMTAIELPFFAREAHQSRPWVVNAFDLEALTDGFLLRGWTAEHFYRYLDGRVVLTGRLSTDDELDVAGYFLKTGDMAKLPTGDNITHQLTGFSEIFDQVFHERLGGDPVDWKAWEAPPVHVEMKEELRKLTAEAPPPTPIEKPYRAEPRPGRNDPCHCGSGRKYKRCHGAPVTS